MSTKRKLWLGFGTLLGMLVITALGVAFWLRSVADELRRVTDKGEPGSRAAYEMKVNSAGTGLGVLNYLHTRAPAYRDRVQQHAADFRKYNAQYERIAKEQDDVAKQVAAVYEEFYLTGLRLMDAFDRREDTFASVNARLLADMRSVAAQAAAATPKERNSLRGDDLLAMERSLSAVGLWLAEYRQSQEARDEQRLAAAENAFQLALARYQASALSAEESDWALGFAKSVGATLDQLRRVLADDVAQQEELKKFFYMRIRLDTLFDEGLLKTAQADLAAAGSTARETLRGVLWAAAFLIGAGVFVSLLTAVLVSRGIVQTEETLRVTLASIGDAVIATDNAGRITFLNRIAATLTGWDQDGAVSRPLGEVLRLIDAATREPIVDPAREVISRGGAANSTDLWVLLARDGSETAVDCNAAPILDEQQRVVGVVLAFRDASQRRRNELVLRDADRRKNEFLAMLAHELRNPLAPLRNGLYILRGPRSDAATRDRVLEMMVRQLQNMTRMIDDLLDVSRITRGKIELRREPVDLCALVDRVADTARPEFTAAERSLAVTLPPHSLWVDGDSTRLEQIVGNLLSNALKYSRSNGHTWVEVKEDDEGVVVQVRDDGLGIAPEMLPLVFDLFAQADSTVARSQGGLGIGLTLVRNLVEMHGGRVSAQSAGVDQGSCFEIHLPRAAEEMAGRDSSAAEPVASPPLVGQVRVLVVDDNVDSADSLSMLLELRGHEVHTAHDGPAAVEMARTLRPQLILLDIGLPGIDGYEVASRLRDDTSLGDPVIVAMTGYGRPEDIERSRRAGFHHHLVKPVDMENLRALFDERTRVTAL